MPRFFTWIITIILSIVIAGLLISKFSNFNFFQIFLVQSGSMEPTIKTGDLIIVKPSNNYQIGDIVTFYNLKNQKITHRIIDIKTENDTRKIFTKGDANKVYDENFISTNQIIGKVNYQIPYLGKLIIFSKTLPGLITLIIIPSLIIVLEEFKKITKSLVKIFSY